MYIKKQYKKEYGFTLIELLASIALFSVVMTIALGAVVTISDSNKKARSLMSVMNNLNFAVDSMTRSFKTGDIKGIVQSNNDNCFETNEALYTGVASSRSVEYCFDTTDKTITKNIGGSAVPLTSADVIIEDARFEIYGNAANEQPLLVIVIDGEVRVTDKINSRFSIHTSVAQRKLNLD